MGKLLRILLLPLDRILAPDCTGHVFPSADLAVRMSFIGRPPELPPIPSRLRITRMSRKDFRPWFRLMYSSGLVRSFCLDGYWRFLRAPQFSRCPTYLAWEGDQLLASASSWETVQDGQTVPLVHLVAVDPTARRNGLGRYLTILVLSELRKRFPNDEAIWLTAGGKPAKELYERLGFKVMSGSLDSSATPE